MKSILNKVTTLGALVLSLGCGAEAPSNVDDDLIDRTPVTLVAGLGASQIPIGMTKQTLVRVRPPSDVVTFDDVEDTEWLIYEQEGMEIVCFDGRVSTVHGLYRSEKYQPFTGKTNQEIDANSTIKDVILTYGQPTWASNRIDRDYLGSANANVVALGYIEAGIDFDFVNQRLTQVSTYAPSEPQEWQRKEIGDTRWIRSIGK